MPRLWNDTIEAHRAAVRDATLDATAALVAEHGLTAVTMSQIAATAGIGRATLYKYFPDVEAILLAWHERQIASHLAQLAEIRDRTSGDPAHQLESVFEAYALIRHRSHRHHHSDLATFLHRDDEVGVAERQMRELIQDLLIAGAATGDLRDDIAPEELASFCLHALTAAATLSSTAAVHRLVAVTLTALHPRSRR